MWIQRALGTQRARSRFCEGLSRSATGPGDAGGSEPARAAWGAAVSFFLGIPLGSLAPLAPESLAGTGEDAGSILPPAALGPRLLRSVTDLVAEV